MTDDAFSLRSNVLLSIQRAMWDMVTPELRCVAVSWGAEFIEARFSYESPLTEVLVELVSEMEAEVIADFPRSVRVDFSAGALPLSESRALGDGEWWVYLRRES
jgi:hypothetical protein